MAITKVSGHVIEPTTNITSHNINSSGIITATRFDGPVGSGLTDGNFSGIITSTQLNVTGVGTFNGIGVTSLNVTGVTTFSDDVKFSGAAHNITFDKSDNALEFQDAAKLKIGTDDDILLHHTGGYSYIEGVLRIGKNDNVRITDAADNTIIGINANAAYLNWNGNTKLTTTNTGAVVTGILTATDFSGAAGGAADFPNGLTGTTATLSGSASVSGDLDVAADIRHIGDENTRISFSSSDTIQLRTGGAARVQIEDGNTTINNNVFLPDNVQLKIGNSVGTPDFKIYHDGNNRLHASNGYMQYRASAHYINDEPNSMNFIRCENSGVKLYYGATARLETKNDGLEVTGNITSNGALTIKTSDVDFVVQDPTDSTTNFIWRDHSASRLYLGVAGIADIMTRSNVSPLGGNNFDLGDTTNRWRNVYTNDLDLSNESKKDEGGNEVDGTWGAYTIQEGESDLFLINRRSGKKYKFNLTEVS